MTSLLKPKGSIALRVALLCLIALLPAFTCSAPESGECDHNEGGSEAIAGAPCD
jgi:hypothetical protein